MFPFGSGMEQQQNPLPYVAPIVYSNPDYPGRPVQMPQPFGSGIGIKSPVTNNNYGLRASVGMPYPSYPQASPNYPQATSNYPQTSPNYPRASPNHPQTSPIHPQATHKLITTTHYSTPTARYTPAVTQFLPSPTRSNYYPPQNNFPVHQPHQNSPPSNVSQGQGYYPNFNNPHPQSTLPNVYQSPNHHYSAPVSYTQFNPNMRRSNGGYMKRKGTPTVLPAENFDVQADAATLRKAMKGFGCDEKALIEVICRRNNQQRQEIQKVFKTNFGKDLIENIKSETRGNFENLLVALLTPTLDFYCKEIHDAMAGLGTDEAVLIEILATLSNYEINTIKAHYNKLYNQDLESAIIGETSGNFKRLLVSLCTANRDETGVSDPETAKADATALLRAGELMFGTDESVFNSVLCQRNYAQLKLIFHEYQVMTGHSFEQAIKNEFSGDIKDGFVAIFRCVNDKAEFFAHQLMKSMKGIGTNDRQLIRLIVTRCEIDMIEIKTAFHKLFNESLKDCIKGDTSGDYKYALYALIGEERSS